MHIYILLHSYSLEDRHRVIPAVTQAYNPHRSSIHPLQNTNEKCYTNANTYSLEKQKGQS